jgi:hypothetical protein
VKRPKKPVPEEVLMRWAREWAKEGVAVDWRKLLPPKGYLVLPRRWVVERTLLWIDQQRRMSKGYEGLCEWRGVGVRCHDSPHDEASRPCLRTFHTASEGVFCELRVDGVLRSSRSHEGKKEAGCKSPASYFFTFSTVSDRHSRGRPYRRSCHY